MLGTDSPALGSSGMMVLFEKQVHLQNSVGVAANEKVIHERME